MFKKQTGMTLVEVLATLLVSSLVIILIWTTVAISMKYNIIETQKLQMQKDVNYIITDIQRIHRNYECYQITLGDQGAWESSKCPSGEIISRYSNPKYKFVLVAPTEQIYTKLLKDEKENYKASYELTVRIYEIGNDDYERPDLEVKTMISRFEEEDSR